MNKSNKFIQKTLNYLCKFHDKVLRNGFILIIYLFKFDDKVFQKFFILFYYIFLECVFNYVFTKIVRSMF